jgi:hypothetical protein
MELYRSQNKFTLGFGSRSETDFQELCLHDSGGVGAKEEAKR